MKSILTLVILLFSSIFSFSQSNYDVVWEALLNNNRTTAAQNAKKIKLDKATDVEALILQQVLANEQGILKQDKRFNELFVLKNDFEYYLYALWKQQFIFTDYLDQGLNKRVFDKVSFFDKQVVKNPTVKAGLTYLNALVSQTKGNFDSFYKYNDHISAIKDWQYCGVFENLNRSGINTSYPPEKLAFSKKDFNANSNGKINWYTPIKKRKEAYQFFSNHLEYGSGINYAQTFITSDKDQTAFIKIGSGKAIKIWLNDVLIFENLKNRVTELDAYTVKINLPKGTNRMLVKTTNNTYSYFIIRMLNEQGNPLSDINITSAYSKYNNSTQESLNPQLQENVFEDFFIKKIKENPSSFFYKYCLINTYLRNSKEVEANKILAPLVEKYPKSSFLRRFQILTYNLEEDYTKAKEVRKNLENDDPDYYFSLVLKFADTKELFRQDVAEMNKTLDKIAAATDSEIIKISCDMFKELRMGNKPKIKEYLNKLLKVAEADENIKLRKTYASLYSTIFNEDNKTIKLYKDIIASYFSFNTYLSLASKYTRANQDEKALNLYKQLYNLMPDDNSVKLKIIKKLQSIHRYKESLVYIDDALQHFPYSFVFMEKKGNALQQLKKTKDAVVWYKKSLLHNSGDSSLRDKINDLKNIEDPLKELIPKEIYTYIKENRGKIKENNFGINILLDEYDVLLYEEGGIKNRSILIYEVTSDNGVNILKEYNLGLSGNYNIIKSEIIKPDASIVPAERSGSSFVFNGLSIGDVVYIDYEANSTGVGRFYKDYSDSYGFDSFHPTLQTYFRVLVPASITLYTQTTNGEVPLNTKKIGGLTLYEWSEGFNKGLPNSENYMPKLVDVARTVHISTLDSWSKIAEWYSDLVSSSIKYNKVVNTTFEELFPDGLEQLSDDQKAKIIYNYIMDTMNYSYVNFKQSGFIPQRPSKTINSKLGDCKDLSTLFLALGRKAGLKVNLVLVNTNDNGQNAIILPSTDFNHCIAKVNLDGEEQYLELTDKNLPYKSLPISLESATALEIPYEKTDNIHKDLIRLESVKKQKTLLHSDVRYIIKDDKQQIEITITSQGRSNSKYNDMLKDPNEEVVKKSIVDYFEGFDKLDLDLESYDIIQRDKNKDQIIFKAVFTIKNKLQKLGKSHVFKLPLQLKPYTSSIINMEDRKFPIEYYSYENKDIYESEYTIVLPTGEKFTFIPENKSLNYKNHHFSITYDKVSDKELKVHISATTALDRISPEEYPEFKKYVQSIMDTVESLIGFE